MKLYQELHIRLVYTDIALELATQLTSAMTDNIDSAISNALETVYRALDALSCRIIIFSESIRRDNYVYPESIVEQPLYETLVSDGTQRAFLINQLSKIGYIGLHRQDINLSIKIPDCYQNANYFLIIPISQRSIFNQSGFLEVSLAENSINSADIEFLKIIGIMILSSVKRINAEKRVVIERDMLSNAVEMATKMIMKSAKTKSV